MFEVSRVTMLITMYHLIFIWMVTNGGIEGFPILSYFLYDILVLISNSWSNDVELFAPFLVFFSIFLPLEVLAAFMVFSAPHHLVISLLFLICNVRFSHLQVNSFLVAPLLVHSLVLEGLQPHLVLLLELFLFCEHLILCINLLSLEETNTLLQIVDLFVSLHFKLTLFVHL